METKRCGSCREILPITNFAPRKDKPEKFLPQCQACRYAKEQTKRKEAQERQREKPAKPLARKPMARKPSVLKRTRINPMSEKRKTVNRQRQEAMLAKFGKRETWKCMGQDIMPHKCFGEIHGHEILSRSRSGQSDKNLTDMDGIITICDWLNGWIEDNPSKAYLLGFTKHSWD
jgi:hypothetical protein